MVPGWWWCVLACGLLGAASVSAVRPDGDACRDGNTCCQDAVGQYQCCPLPGAVCCSDGLHCCPGGTACDLRRATCSNKTLSVPWRRSLAPEQSSVLPWHAVARRGTTLKVRAARMEILRLLSKRQKMEFGASSARQSGRAWAVVCPDRRYECPDETTCCRLPDDSWGCCPLTKAVCCDDKRHCCPEGTACDLSRSRCVSAGGDRRGWSPLMGKLPARPRPHLTADCPDKRSTCPDENTCCQLRSGEYACCPAPEAACCPDGLRCCPRGTACNLAAGTCDERPASVGAASPPDTKCDESASCPGTSTCCRDAAGDWACCPLRQAQCCEDGAHCCPHGKRCNLEAGTCDDPSGAGPPLALLAKTLAVTTGDACDQRTSCPKGASCCFMASVGKWGCCPLPQAVCCQDGSHCCPAGHTCQPRRSSCSRGGRVIPWLAKTPAVRRPAPVADVKCDDKSSCAAGATCCRLPTGEWGCCPLVKAVCCADREHCCPQGYSCNMETGTCEKPARVDGALPCDAAATFACAEQETCCRSSSGQWACCPSPRAVCCADMKHCCPAHYSCDPSGGCVRTAPAWASLARASAPPQ